MGGVELIRRARAAGLKVQEDNGLLKVRGPKRLADLAQELIANKDEVLVALSLPAPEPEYDAVDPGTGTETPKSPAITGVMGPSLRSEGASTPTDCGSLHIQPQHWVHRDGRAYCPGCEKFMGYVRGGQ